MKGANLILFAQTLLFVALVWSGWREHREIVRLDQCVLQLQQIVFHGGAR